MSRVSGITLLVSIFLWSNLSIAQQIMRKITVTGHRGAAAIAPENTMLSIQKAVLLKVDRVEIDIHQSKDGKLVVIHDATLDRTTDGKGKVKNYTYGELRKFNIDSSTERLSTLQDAMDWCNNKTILLIDVKRGHGHYKGFEENLVNVIKENEFHKKCIVQSWNTKLLKTIHELDPDIVIHKLVVLSWLTNFKGMAMASEFTFDHRRIKKKTIHRVHELEKKINVYTVNDASDVTKLVTLGVDGIITDDPRLILDRQKPR